MRCVVSDVTGREKTALLGVSVSVLFEDFKRFSIMIFKLEASNY